ncbi:MAG: hypothetical protein ABH854_04030 [Candidatus Diapherotrites archaeon]|nr:hypothetical protein [Candidatus Micrarchaeota archaeon]MBU1939271.1 hypothetical protein [Candidatus Micrarchaeota archaeon]
MYITDSFRRYVDNFPTAFAFALLLVFVVLFTQLEGAFISSGSIFLDYGLFKPGPVALVLLLLVSLAFLFFYSVLLTLMIFAIRRDLSRVRLHYYLSERITKFSFKMFRFLALFAIILILIAAVLTQIGVPALLVGILLLAAAVAFLFVPQSIVVDEESLRSSISSNFEFIRAHPGAVLRVLAAGFVIMLILPLLEYLLDLLTLALNFAPLMGNFATLFITFVFVMPYLEVLKTEFYMNKYELVRRSHEKIEPPVMNK